MYLNFEERKALCPILQFVLVEFKKDKKIVKSNEYKILLNLYNKISNIKR